MVTITLTSSDWLALASRVATLVTDPALPTYEPGAIVERPNEPHILLSDVRNDNERMGLDATTPHMRSGTLMLAIQWPLGLAVSHTQLTQLQGVVAEHFLADTCCVYGASRLRVTQDADALQPYVDGAFRVAVVRVFWSSV